MKYFIRKIVGLFVTIILVSLVTFGVFQILPGNPAYIILGVDADPLQIEALTESLGLDLPLYQRYFNWVKGVLQGDLGTSIRYQQPVSELIASGLEVTAGLTVMSMILTVAIGVPIGIWLAGHSEKKYSVGVSMLSQLSLSIPSFCMGIFLINIFSVQLKWFPTISYVSWSEDPLGSIRSLFLPALSISLGSSATLIRYIKVSVTNQKKQDYVRTAYSKGLNKRQVMYGHVLRNSMIPVVTILGMTVADILGGSIIVENIFSLPGIGRLISVSINSRDLPLIQGLVLYLAVIVVICNFVVDIVYSLIDPRIRVK